MDPSRNSHVGGRGELNVDDVLRETLEDGGSGMLTACALASLLPRTSTSHLAATVATNESIESGDIAAKATDSGRVCARRRKYIFVVVRPVAGAAFRLRLRETDTVERIKHRIAAKSDVPCTQQQLIFNGIELRDLTDTATALGIQDGSTLTMTLRLQTGPLSVQEDSGQSRRKRLLDVISTRISEFALNEKLVAGQRITLVARLNGKVVVARLRLQAKSAENDDCDLTTTAKPAHAEIRETENERTKQRMEEIRSRLAAKRQKMTMSSAASQQRAATTVEAAGGDFAILRGTPSQGGRRA